MLLLCGLCEAVMKSCCLEFESSELVHLLYLSCMSDLALINCESCEMTSSRNQCFLEMLSYSNTASCKVPYLYYHKPRGIAVLSVRDHFCEQGEG